MLFKPFAVVLGASALAVFVYTAVALTHAPAAIDSAQVETQPMPLDAYAGQTIKNVAMGLEVMRSREENCPAVGELAPDFELLTTDGESTLRLSSLRGGKPVVLIFGSYT